MSERKKDAYHNAFNPESGVTAELPWSVRWVFGVRFTCIWFVPIYSGRRIRIALLLRALGQEDRRGQSRQRHFADPRLHQQAVNHPLYFSRGPFEGVEYFVHHLTLHRHGIIDVALNQGSLRV